MKIQTADNTMFGTRAIPGGQRGRRRLAGGVAALSLAVGSLLTGPKVSAAQTDFESFTTGISVHYQGPGSTTVWNGYTIPNPYGSLWTVSDEWGLGRIADANLANDYDERVVYDSTGTNKVWRVSNAITSGGFSDLPNALSTCVAAGETNAGLYNYRGPNHTTPSTQIRAYAQQRLFHMQLRFKSATDAAQAGLGIQINATARQSDKRMTWVNISDPGSGGFNIGFYESLVGGTFNATATTIATGVSYADWHTLDISVEFVDGLNPDGTGNDIVTVKLDGTPIHTGTSWETYYRALSPPTVMAVDAIMFRPAGPAAPVLAGGGLFIDDVLVEIPDAIAPSITCPSDVTVNADAGQCLAAGVSLGTPTTSDNASPSCSSVTVTSDAPAQFPVGTNLVTWTATDSAGNSSTCVQTVIVVDSENPTVTCPADVTTTAASGQCSASVSFAATSSDNCGVASTVYAIGVTPIPSPYAFPVGETTVNVTVTDVNGNTATCSFKVTVTDTEPPSVVCDNKTVYLDASGAAVIVPADVYASGSDNCGTVTPVSVSPNSFTCANLGANTVTLTVQDASGNTATCNATVTVVDLMAPVVTCQPATVMLDAGGNASVTAADVFASAIDNCGTINLVGVSPSSFTCAQVGANTVTLTVNDGHGNVGTCQATVTVVDNEAPVLVNCPEDKTQVNSLSLVYSLPTATDNCPDGVTVVCNPPPGSTMDPGPNTVTCTATDASGNTDTCTFTVTVTATTALMYNGVFLDVDGNGSSVLTATLSSPLAGCAASQPLVFTVMQGATVVATATATTDASGKATVTVPLAGGVYDVTVSFAGDDYCSGSVDTAVLTIASPGDSVYGGGWYKATSSPVTKASFGLVAQRKYDRKTASYFYSGNLVWVHHKKHRLKSTAISGIGTTTVTGYAKSALVSGTGQLSSWIVDGSYLEGGYWSAPVTVGFVATVCDGGTVTVKKVPSDKPDAFGMNVGGSTIALPGETGPIVLSGGSLKVN